MDILTAINCISKSVYYVDDDFNITSGILKKIIIRDNVEPECEIYGVNKEFKLSEIFNNESDCKVKAKEVIDNAILELQNKILEYTKKKNDDVESVP